MSADLLSSRQIQVRATGQRITVPENDIACLMYYLGCACSVINCDDESDIQRFTDYANWSHLSTDDQRKLIHFCYTLSPDVFENKAFFQSDGLCGSSSNKFYEINYIHHQIPAAKSIAITGRTRQVNKIMTYKREWMNSYYVEPMSHQARLLESDQRRPTRCTIS